MKWLLTTMLFCLSGCFSGKNDLELYIAQVKQNVTPKIAPMPVVSPFNHFDYSAQTFRSPFIAPKPEVLLEKMRKIAGCLSPDPDRTRETLEKFSLADIIMRGTLRGSDKTWVLLEASDASVHRVAVGSYLGLYHGRIVKVSQENIQVVELVPDGAGCWVERETLVSMLVSDIKR
jgi:type IV pilus assembly protein PilP